MNRAGFAGSPCGTVFAKIPGSRLPPCRGPLRSCRDLLVALSTAPVGSCTVSVAARSALTLVSGGPAKTHAPPSAAPSPSGLGGRRLASVPCHSATRCQCAPSVRHRPRVGRYPASGPADGRPARTGNNQRFAPPPLSPEAPASGSAGTRGPNPRCGRDARVHHGRSADALGSDRGGMVGNGASGVGQRKPNCGGTSGRCGGPA